MVLLDRLETWSPTEARASVNLRRGMRFVEGDSLDSLFLIEHMAQTIAASLGYEAYLDGRGVRRGMLVGCRKYEVHVDEIHVGDTLSIEVARISHADAMSRFDCRAKRGKELVSSASLTLFHGELPH